MSSIQSLLKIIQDAAKIEIIKRSKSIAPTSQPIVLTQPTSSRRLEDSSCSNTHRRCQSLPAATHHTHTLSQHDAYKEPLLEFQQSDELDYRSQMGNSRVASLSKSSWISFFRSSDNRTGNSARVTVEPTTDNVATRQVEERRGNTHQKDLYWGNVDPGRAQDARFKLFQPSTWFSMVAGETAKQTPPRQETLEEYKANPHKYVRESKQRQDNDRYSQSDPFELIRQYKRQVPSELSKPIADSKIKKQTFTTTSLHKKLLACVENWSRHLKDTKSKSSAEVKMTQEAPEHISTLSAGHDSYLPRPRLQPNASKFVEGLFHETRHFSMQSRQYGSSTNSKQAYNAIIGNVKDRVETHKKKTCVVPVTGTCGCGPRQYYKPPVNTHRKCKKNKKESTGSTLQLLPGCGPRARPNLQPISKELPPCSKVNAPLPSFSDMMRQTKFSRPIDSRLFDDLKLLQPSLSLGKKIELHALKIRKNRKAELKATRVKWQHQGTNKANENVDLATTMCSPQPNFGVGYTREAAFPSGLLIVQPPPPKSSDELSPSPYLSPAALGGQHKLFSATIPANTFLNTRSFSSYARPDAKNPHKKIGEAKVLGVEGKTLHQRVTDVRNVLKRRASLSKEMSKLLEKQTYSKGYFPSKRTYCSSFNHSGNEFEAPESNNGLHSTIAQPPPPKCSDGLSRSPYWSPALRGQHKLLSAKIHTNTFPNARYFSSYPQPEVKDLHEKIGEAKLLEVEGKTLQQRIIDVRNVLKRYAFYSKQIPKLHEKDTYSTGYFPSKRTYYSTFNHGGNEFEAPEINSGLHSTMLNENDVHSITRDISPNGIPCFADGYLRYSIDAIKAIRKTNETDDKSVAKVESLDLTEVSPESKIYDNITNEINSQTGPNKINFYEPNNPLRFSKDKTLLNMHKTAKMRRYSPSFTTETNKKFKYESNPKFQVIERFSPKLKFVSSPETFSSSKESLKKIQQIRPFSASLDPSLRKASANLHKTVKLANYQSGLIHERNKRNYFITNPISYQMDPQNIGLKSTNIPADTIGDNNEKITRPLISFGGNARSHLVDTFLLNLIDKQQNMKQATVTNNTDSYKIIYDLQTASKLGDQTKNRRAANEFVHSSMRKQLSNTHKTTKLKQPPGKEDNEIRKYNYISVIPQVQIIYSQGYSDLQTYPRTTADKAKKHSLELKYEPINAVKPQLQFAPEHKFHATYGPSIYSLRKTLSNMHKTTPIKRFTSLSNNISRKYHTDSVHASYDTNRLVYDESYNLCTEKVTNLVKTIEELKCSQLLKEDAYKEIAVLIKHDLMKNYKNINGETNATKSANHVPQHKHDIQQLLTILNNSSNSSHAVQTNMHKRFFANKVCYKLKHNDCDIDNSAKNIKNSAEKKKPTVSDCCAKKSARKPFKECIRPPQMIRNPSRTCVDYRKPTIIKCDYKTQKPINGDVRGVNDRVAKVGQSNSNVDSPNKYGAAFDAVEASLKNKKCATSQADYSGGLVDAVCVRSEKMVNTLTNSFANSLPSKETTGDCKEVQLKEEKQKQQDLNRESERSKAAKIVGSACERNEMFVSTLKHRMTNSQFSEIAHGESSEKNLKIEKTKPSHSLAVKDDSASLRKESIVNILEHRMLSSSCASTLKPVSKSSKSDEEEKSHLTLQCAHAESRRIEERSLNSKQDCIQDCIKNNGEINGKDRIMAANSHRFEHCNTKEETNYSGQEMKDSSKCEWKGNGEKERESNVHETSDNDSKYDSDSIKEMIMEANKHRFTTCSKSVPREKTYTVPIDSHYGAETAFESPCKLEEVHAGDRWAPCRKIKFSCPANQEAMTPQTSQYEAQSPVVSHRETETLTRVESQTSPCSRGIQLKPGSSTPDVFTFPAKTNK